MLHNIEVQQQAAIQWFAQLRDDICRQFEELENQYGSSHSSFHRTTWAREGGGGGQMSIMKGQLFEKVGVNISTVFGKFSEQFSKEIPGTDKNNSEFWASGISLVAHMNSPFIPAIHMNTRYIVTSKSWFGGGIDLTPTFPIEAETKLFHTSLMNVCNNFDPEYYPKFKKACDEYFFLPHRNETRGVGGIFFDYLNTGNWNNDFAFVQAVGNVITSIFKPMIEKHGKTTWSHQEKEQQCIKRGRYAEFNLLYDRGTRFGLMTGGNIEAILMSMPPQVRWV